MAPRSCLGGRGLGAGDLVDQVRDVLCRTFTKRQSKEPLEQRSECLILRKCRIEITDNLIGVLIKQCGRYVGKDARNRCRSRAALVAPGLEVQELGALALGE